MADVTDGPHPDSSGMVADQTGDTLPNTNHDAIDGDLSTQAKKSWYHRFFRQVARVAVRVAAILVLLTGIGIYVLDTGPGHRFITDRLAAYEFENGMQIRIGRLDGSIYRAMVIHDLSLRDPDGEFLFSPQLNVNWRLLDLVRRHLNIRTVLSERVILQRLPQFRETQSDEPLLPDLDIDVGRLAVTRFIAKVPNADTPEILKITGKAHIVSGVAQLKLDSRVIAGGNSAGGDRLLLDLDAVPDKNRLAIKLDLNAPRGGLIAAMAGLTEPLAVRLDGKGDWASWAGRLDADLGGADLARLKLNAADGRFSLQGPVHAQRLTTGPVAALLSSVTHVNLAADLKERRADLSGEIKSAAFRLSPQGIVDLGQSRFDRLRVDFALLQPSALLADLSGSAIRGGIVANGAFARPVIDYALRADHLAMNDMGLRQVAATGQVTVGDKDIAIPLGIQAASVTGLDGVAGGAIGPASLKGDVILRGGRLLADNLHLSSRRINAQIKLAGDMAKGRYNGSLTGEVNQYRLESVGIFNASTAVDARYSSRGPAISGRVHLRTSRLLNDTLANVLGGDALAVADLGYAEDGVFRLSGLRLAAPDVSITHGEGSYSPDGRVAFAANAKTRAYGQLGLRVTGTIARPDARITAERPGLGIGLAELEARVKGAGQGYHLEATGKTDYGPLSADVILGLGKQTSLAINTADIGGIAFAGGLLQTPQGPFAGTLTANGRGLGGVLQLSAIQKYQQVVAHLRAKDTVFEDPAQVSIGSAIIDAQVVLYDQPKIIADAQVSAMRYGDMLVNAARVQVNYQAGAGHAQALFEGTRGVPFRLAANADLAPRLWTVALNGRSRGVSFATVNPARIEVAKDGFRLLPVHLTAGRGKVALQGEYGQQIKAEARLERVNLALINAFLPGYGIGGSASGGIDFALSPRTGEPDFDARLHVDNFTRTTAAVVSQPIGLNLLARLNKDGGEARAVIRTRDTVVGRMVANLRPVANTGGQNAQGIRLDRLMTMPLDGGIRYNGPADTLFSFVGLANQRFEGPIGVAADFSCRLAAPCVKGVIRANNLVYENLTYGTRLTQMALTGRFDGDVLHIEKLSAQAGPGTLSATGNVNLSAESGFPMDIAAVLDNARLAHSGEITASATGNLRLVKTANGLPLLSGELQLPETRYQMVRRYEEVVPVLTGVRFKPSRKVVRVTGDEPAPPSASALAKIRMDLALIAREKLYVSGMGLDSEWSANLRVTGTSTEPRLVGEVDIIRGDLDFAGRSFKLDRGHIAFTGGKTINPTIDMTAVEEIDDISVTVAATGRAFAPQITFTSTPALPQDEVISRILFGQSIETLSAVQAVQLASSLNALRASGGGLNPLGSLRSATGIDRLRILDADEASGRQTALAAGQYLTRNIYVELITDARGFTATQIEIALNRWLSLLSSAGGSGMTDLNLRVKKNY